MSKDVWVFAEQKDHRLSEISFELLAWGRKLAEERQTALCAVVLADKMPQEELDRLACYGADKVYLVLSEVFTHFLLEPQAHTMMHLVELYQPEIILAGATTTGRTVMPYLAALLHTGLTADCTGLEIEAETGNLLQIRPAIGGNIMATIKTPNTRPQMATVRPKSIRPLEPDTSHQGEFISPSVPEEALTSRMKFEGFIPEGGGSAVLEEANIVISGGLGMQNLDSFRVVEAIAKLLSAAIGSSRPPVDHGWQPYVRQVGLSGRTISPELYIACGISGSVQHLAGIQTAKNIIAINSDPEAPIFQVSDFGIVGDAFLVLPALKKCLEERIQGQSEPRVEGSL